MSDRLDGRTYPPHPVPSTTMTAAPIAPPPPAVAPPADSDTIAVRVAQADPTDPDGYCQFCPWPSPLDMARQVRGERRHLHTVELDPPDWDTSTGPHPMLHTADCLWVAARAWFDARAGR